MSDHEAGDAPPPEWVTVAAPGDLPRGRAMRVDVEGREVALFHLADGEWRALGDACPHAGFALHDSEVDGHRVTCALHHWVFSLDDGKCLFGARAAQSFAVKVEAGAVMVAPARRDHTKASKLMRKIQVSLAHGVVAQLPELVDRALELGVPALELIALARTAATSQLLPSLDALEGTLAQFPGVPPGDVALAALCWATRAGELAPPPAAAPVSPPAARHNRFRGEDGLHLRRRLVAVLEKRDAAGAVEVADAYLAAGHNPCYFAQDVIRAALESHALLMPVALEVASDAYRWQDRGATRLFELLASLCAAGMRDAASA